MNFMKLKKTTFSIVSMALCLAVFSGCAPREVMKSSKGSEKDEQMSLLRKAYDHDMSEAAKAGYREGVRQGAEAAGRMRGGYVWRPYKVEPVQVPGRVVNGIMIPSHQEEVIVRPTRVDRVFDSDLKHQQPRKR